MLKLVIVVNKSISLYIKSSFTLDVLVKNKDMILRKIPDAIIDQASLEDIMLFTVKGERL